MSRKVIGYLDSYVNLHNDLSALLKKDGIEIKPKYYSENIDEELSKYSIQVGHRCFRITILVQNKLYRIQAARTV